jgi:hypothetical protein
MLKTYMYWQYNGINFTISSGVAYEVCNRKQETDRKLYSVVIVRLFTGHESGGRVVLIPLRHSMEVRLIL